jgi:hypothetical protein
MNLGTMVLSAPNTYNQSQHMWYNCKAMEVNVPRVYYKGGHLQVDVSTIDKECAAVSSPVLLFDAVDHRKYKPCFQ